MTSSIRITALILLALATLPFNAVYAQMEAVQEEPGPTIEVDGDAPRDSEIRRRITGILSKMEGLGALTVDVESGVVTLQGDVANEAQAQSALQIANRTAGVVEVIDQINRTLDVGDNVEPLINDFKSSIRGFIRALPLTLLALAIVVVFILLGSVVARWTWLWQRIAPNPFLAEILSQAVRVIVIALGLILALNLVGASRFIATILGGAGVLGIAIGFAVRDTLENYISSIMLSLRQPFRAHDHVVINEYEGFVVRLTSRATILMTLDGNHLRIPNSVVFKGIILNYTTNPERRFDFLLGVDANDDPLDAMEVGLNAINQNDFVLKDPAAGALIDEVGDSSIVIKFTGWVDQSKHSFGKVRSVAIKSAITALEDQGFTLPEPIYRVRFDGPLAGLQAAFAEKGTGDTVENEQNEKFKPEVAGQIERQERPPLEPDVSVERDIRDKVFEERAKDGDSDLLDNSQPTE